MARSPTRSEQSEDSDIEILDLRPQKNDKVEHDMKAEILAGLRKTQTQVPGQTEEDKQWAYSKEIPTMVLYDHLGLDIYDQITNCSEYYLFNAELDILKKYGADISRRMFGLAKTNSHKSAPISNDCNGDHPQEDHQIKPDNVKVSEKWGDRASGTSNYGVNGNFGLANTTSAVHDEQRPHGVVVELGAGSLRKTSYLIQALAQQLEARQGGLKSCDYYALDLEYGQLVSTLKALHDSEQASVSLTPDSKSKVTARGICASYDEALPFIRSGKLDFIGTNERSDSPNGEVEQKRTILFLGSSIGNYSPEAAATFLQSFSNAALAPGDSFLIGIDSCDDKEQIEAAYNDKAGVTADFILNGVTVVNDTLGKAGLSRDDFDYVNRYNQREGRNEAYLKAKKDLSVQVDGDKISFEKDELIAIERSYKYKFSEALKLFESAGLRLVEHWTDTTVGCYKLYLLEKPPFNFESTAMLKHAGKNPFGVPTIEEWQNLWAAWDTVTLGMIPRDLLHSKPIDLRHICLFYLGHIPAFADLKIAGQLQEPFTQPQHYPEMFERGIDPNMEDPSKCHAHSVVPEKMEDWPSVDEICSYRDQVRKRIKNVYTKHIVTGEANMRLGRVIQNIYEHEAMHLETLLYMCAQIEPGRLNAAPFFKNPDWHHLKHIWEAEVEADGRESRQAVLKFEESRVSIGHDDLETEDGPKLDRAHKFGWDNESPIRHVTVPAFSIAALPVTNAEYLNFFAREGRPTSLLPGSWLKDEKSGAYKVRVLAKPGLVDMDVAQHWPVMASGSQLGEYAKSKGARLPTEGELRRFMDDHPVDSVGSNVGFKNLHPIPARVSKMQRDGTFSGASNGGVWEWTSTEFASYEGFRPSDLYPNYSKDFFDGCHNVILGGSFATINRIAGRRSFRNWYQNGYPYVFAGGRLAWSS